ncbi:MAG: hypothetical protein J2P48_18810, partial [Alphaproteobacteria bacterium]|nr:hypothetical protein [Alphaproteobacteria bacterium]
SGFVACCKVRADAGIVKPPVTISAADLAIDNFTDRGIGPGVQAPGGACSRNAIEFQRDHAVV